MNKDTVLTSERPDKPPFHQSSSYEMFHMVQINVWKMIHEHYMIYSLIALITCCQRKSQMKDLVVAY